MSEPDLTSPPRGQRKLHTRLDPATWAIIRQQWESGLSDAACARLHDVDDSTVWRRRTRERWVRPAPQPPAPKIADCETLEQLLQFAAGEILSAYKAEGHAAAREIAKSAEVLARLQSRLSPRRAGAATDTDDASPTFKPERDVFELLAELGLKPEDVH